MTLDIKKDENRLILGVKVVPGSSSNRIAGEYDGMVKINIAAAPEKGKANKELICFLAKKLKKPKSSLTLIAGEHDSRKQIAINSATIEEITEHLGI